MENELFLKNGAPFFLRTIELNDAASMISYIESIASESDNLTFGPGELKPSIDDEREFIKSYFEKTNCIFLVAIQNERIIGSLSFEGGGRMRINHTGEFGVSVLKEFWGNGIATALIKHMLKWAESSSITKINLKTREDNLTAIALYEKLGFKIEGRLKKEFRVDGVYYDSIMMGKIIDRQKIYIKKLSSKADAPMNLLLLADPSEKLVKSYLDKGICYTAEIDEKTVGVVLIMETKAFTMEVMNLAVKEEYQNNGIGKLLLLYVIEEIKKGDSKIIEIGTGNPGVVQMLLYQKCGFRIVDIDFDFFRRTHPERIYENGIECRDMIRMRIDL